MESVAAWVLGAVTVLLLLTAVRKGRVFTGLAPIALLLFMGYTLLGPVEPAGADSPEQLADQYLLALRSRDPDAIEDLVHPYYDASDEAIHQVRNWGGSEPEAVSIKPSDGEDPLVHAHISTDVEPDFEIRLVMAPYVPGDGAEGWWLTMGSYAGELQALDQLPYPQWITVAIISLGMGIALDSLRSRRTGNSVRLY